jgi:chaperonin GroES
MKLATPLSLDTILNSENLAPLLTVEECKAIGMWCQEGLVNDEQSREVWAEDYAEALNMAMQVTQPKSEPWEGASNVRFPLISIAALHWSARAYPMLVPGNDIVACSVFGTDPDGTKTDRAIRIGRHMSWQQLEQMTEWEEEHDKCLMVMGIVGLAIKKTYFNTALQRNQSLCITPSHLVLNYWAKGPIDGHQRASLLFEASANDCYSNIAQGLWCDDDYADAIEGESTTEDDDEAGEPAMSEGSIIGTLMKATGELPTTDVITEATDDRTGLTPPQVDSTTPYLMVEQSCWIDLDNDGYAEPYFVTFERETGQIRRIVARFNTSDVKKRGDKVIRITPEGHYTAYKLIPSPDASFYPVGFGRLLGSLDDTVSTALNELIDTATLANYGGGFLGRGARMRGGSVQTDPGQWHNVDVQGGTLRDNMVPFPNNQPSQVLFQIITFLVQYAERLVSANELQQGEDIGQNTPAQTAQTMDENGSRIFAGMFKRAWRAQRDECRILFSLNQKYLKADVDFLDLTTGKGAMLAANDYLGPSTDVCPAADPNVMSDGQRVRNAQATMQLAMTLPGFNRYQTIVRYLKAKKEPNIDQIFPPPQQPGGDIAMPPSAQMMVAQVKQGLLQDRIQRTKQELMKMQVQAKEKLMALQQQAMLIQSEIIMNQAQGVLNLATSKAKGQETAIAQIDSMIGAKKVHLQGVLGLIEQMTNYNSMLNDQSKGFSDATNEAQQPEAPGNGKGQPLAQGMGQPEPNEGIFAPAPGGSPIHSGPVGLG